MLKFIKNIDIKNKNYIIDKKTIGIIEKYMKKIGIKNINFLELLVMLELINNSKLYFKIENERNKLMIYYSYDKNIWDTDKCIYFDNRLNNCIVVINKNKIKEYVIKYSDNNEKIYLENKKYVYRRIVDGIEYYIYFCNKEFNFLIKNNVGREIKFNCDGIKDKNKLFNILNDNLKLEEYIFDIKLDSSIDNVFECWISLFKEIGFTKIELLSILDKEIISSYIINNYNNILRILNESYLKKIFYERIITNKDIDLYNVLMVLKNEKYRFEIEYLDNFNDDIVNNEFKLVSWLKKLSFPIEIEDIYNDVSRISLGNINRYKDISLKVYCNEERINFFRVKNGLLDYFENIDGSRSITIDRDGVFSYINENDISGYMVEIDGDIITKCKNINNDNLDYNDMYDAIKEAREEKVKVRKLMDKLVR